MLSRFYFRFNNGMKVFLNLVIELFNCFYRIEKEKYINNSLYIHVQNYDNLVTGIMKNRYNVIVFHIDNHEQTHVNWVNARSHAP